MPNDQTPNGPQLASILRTLSPDQIRFVQRRIYERTDADAARELGIPVSTVYSWDNKAAVNEAVMLARADGVHVAQERLTRLLAKAIDVLDAEMDDNRNRLDAAREVMDRALGKAVQKQEHSGPGGGAIEIRWGDGLPVPDVTPRPAQDME